jgi:putative acetyltransferase
MFVHDRARGLGVGAALLGAIEDLARGLGIHTLRLETGEPQQAAIRMYEHAGYAHIERFGPYVDDPTSICMARPLTPAPTRASRSPQPPRH